VAADIVRGRMDPSDALAFMLADRGEAPSRVTSGAEASSSREDAQIGSVAPESGAMAQLQAEQRRAERERQQGEALAFFAADARARATDSERARGKRRERPPANVDAALAPVAAERPRTSTSAPWHTEEDFFRHLGVLPDQRGQQPPARPREAVEARQVANSGAGTVRRAAGETVLAHAVPASLAETRLVPYEPPAGQGSATTVQLAQLPLVAGVRPAQALDALVPARSSELDVRGWPTGFGVPPGGLKPERRRIRVSQKGHKDEAARQRAAEDAAVEELVRVLPRCAIVVALGGLQSWLQVGDSAEMRSMALQLFRSKPGTEASNIKEVIKVVHLCWDFAERRRLPEAGMAGRGVSCGMIAAIVKAEHERATRELASTGGGGSVGEGCRRAFFYAHDRLGLPFDTRMCVRAIVFVTAHRGL
jgi:hypothetical protein